MKILYILLAISFSTNILAADYEASAISTVKFISSYNHYGNGDVQVRLETNSPSCSSGYWLTKNDPGFEANLSMLLASAHSQSKIRIYGLPSERWPGSSSIFCKVYSIEFHK